MKEENTITTEAPRKLFSNILLFSLFGIALGFFGMLYEGIVFVPKMLDNSMQRMLFWRDFYSSINPVGFYIPLLPLASITLIALYFKTSKQNTEIKKRLAWASIFQILSLIITFYIVTQINLKLCFSNIEKYAGEIPTKTLLINVLSIFRMTFSALALAFVFKAFIQLQKDKMKL